MAAKSPLTGAYGEAEAGGFWGPELKFAGFDAVIVTGKAEKPSYLWINDGTVEIRSAEKIWGLETGPAQEQIRDELGEKRARVALIGPAGENLVRYACVVNELKHANGRTGMGAVMGSKNLKAVAVRGTKKMDIHDPEKLRELSKELTELIGRHGPNKVLHKLGTSNLVMAINNQGILPTRNFRTGFFEGAAKISGERMAETILKSEEGCYACAVRCKRAVEIPSGPYATSSMLRRAGIRNAELAGIASVHRRSGGHRQGERAVQPLYAGHHFRRCRDRFRHGVLREGHPHQGRYGGDRLQPSGTPRRC